MTYKELLEKYKSGQLSEAETEKVKAEIEKQNAISEFLFDQELGLSDVGMNFDEEVIPPSIDDKKITDEINSSIHRAFVKAGVITGIVAVVVALLLVFAMPKVVSTFYYNPDKTVYEDANLQTNQMSKDMGVYAELNMPELGPNVSVTVDSNGYGNYNTYMLNCFHVGDNQYGKGYAGKVVRNSGLWYDPYSLEFKSQDVSTFAWGDAKNLDKSLSSQMAERKADAKTAVSRLGDDEEYYAYVSFDKMMGYDDLLSFINKNRKSLSLDDSFIWAATRTDEKSIQNNGFMVTAGSDRQSYVDADENSPLLSWNENGEITELASEEEAATHLKSMMQYLMDNEEFSQIAHYEPDYDAHKQLCEDALNYVDQNGLQIYGIMLVSSKANIQKILEDKNVFSVVTDVVR